MVACCSNVSSGERCETHSTIEVQVECLLYSLSTPRILKNNFHCGLKVDLSSVMVIHSQSLEYCDLGSLSSHFVDSASKFRSCFSNEVNSA